MKISRTSLPIFLILLSLSGISTAQGLQFKSMDELTENRTSYNVFNKSDITFSDYFTLNMQLSIVDPSTFGYICDIQEINSSLDYTLVYVNNNDTAFFLKFNEDNKKNQLSIPLNKNDLGKGRWFDLSIEFNSMDDIITIIYNEVEYSIEKNISQNKLTPEINFGKYKSFIDVPSFALRNLSINDSKRKCSFPFNENTGTEVHNSYGKLIGKVENPIWLVNESYHWKLRHSYSSDDVTILNYDEANQRMVIISRDSLSFYNFNTNSTQHFKQEGTLPVPVRLATSFIDSVNNLMYVYEVNDFDFDKPSIAALDLDSHNWLIKSYNQLPNQRHHHTGYFDALQQQYLIFGGYGVMQYFNKFNLYDIESKEWNSLTFSGDTIYPRFFSGMVPYANNSLIIFGGSGNLSGEQSAGKIYFHDCYKVNLGNRSIKKMWDLNTISKNMVSARNMVLSEDSASFYTLYYPEYIPNSYLNLYKFSIETGEYTILGDSIPILSERIETNANLFCNNLTNELYCTVQEIKEDGASNIRIYSISKTPISEDAFYQEYSQNINRRLLSLFIIVFILTLLIWIYKLLRTRIKKQKKIKEQQKYINDKRSLDLKVSKNKEDTNAIYLFGDFTVYSKTGQDISHLFSPKVKLLFLYILLNSNKKTVGVSSEKIYAAIWPEKDNKQAKNLKGVTQNQLRKILNDLEGIELVYEKGLFYFNFQEAIYCDYFELQLLLEDLQIPETNREEIIQKLLSIVSEGPFLKSLNNKCFDTFKQKLEIKTQLILPTQLEKYFKNKDYLQTISIAQILNHIELLNEYAFYYELMSYMKLEMPEMAKKCYTSFLIDYKSTLDENFPHTFREITEENPFKLGLSNK